MSTDYKAQKIKVRGTGTFGLADNSFKFAPFNEGPSTQVNVKKCAGGGKRWTTTGSDPSKILTLKTKESSADQYADLVSQFNALTKDMKPKKRVEMPKGTCEVKEAGLECYVNEQKKEMTFRGTIDLSKHVRDWQAEVLKQVQLIVRRLPASDRFNKLVNNLKKQEVTSNEKSLSRKY